jgi:hypothetical protein
MGSALSPGNWTAPGPFPGESRRGQGGRAAGKNEPNIPRKTRAERTREPRRTNPSASLNFSSLGGQGSEAAGKDEPNCRSVSPGKSNPNLTIGAFPDGPNSASSANSTNRPARSEKLAARRGREKASGPGGEPGPIGQHPLDHR